MKYKVIHETRYLYSETVSECHSLARLVPRNLPGQKLLRSQLTVDPMPSAYREHEDVFQNTVCYFAVHQPHDHLTVTAASVVEVEEGDPAIGLPETVSPAWEEVRGVLRNDTSAEVVRARPFVLPSPHITPSPRLEAYAAPSFTAGRPVLHALMDLMGRIHREFAFVPGYTTVATPLDEVIDSRKGVCQDFAHLAIGCLRSIGLAARYVSGYIETLPRPGRPKLRGADVSHAWFSAFVPGFGWVGYDPTNDLLPGSRHVTVAFGRDYSDVVPVKGVIFSSGGQRLLVSVDMERLDH